MAAGARARQRTVRSAGRHRRRRVPRVDRMADAQPCATSSCPAATRRPPCARCCRGSRRDFSVIVVDNGSTRRHRRRRPRAGRARGDRADGRVRRGRARRAAGRDRALRRVMDGDGSFDPADAAAPARRRRRAGPTSPSAAAGRWPAASGRGTPGPATRWSSPGCAAASAWPPTTSPRCGCAAARRCSTSTCEDRRFGYPVELLAERHPGRLAVPRARRRLPPAGRGHPLEGLRLGAGHAADRPRLLAGARVTPRRSWSSPRRRCRAR